MTLHPAYAFYSHLRRKYKNDQGEANQTSDSRARKILEITNEKMRTLTDHKQPLICSLHSKESTVN